MILAVNPSRSVGSPWLHMSILGPSVSQASTAGSKFFSSLPRRPRYTAPSFSTEPLRGDVIAVKSALTAPDVGDLVVLAGDDGF